MRFSTAELELSKAKGRLEDAMKKNEVLEDAIDEQQYESVKSRKKQGVFRRWHRRKERKSQ